MKKIFSFLLAGLAFSCNNADTNNREAASKDKADTLAAGSFGYDLNFLRQYQQDLVLLSDSDGAQVLISPAYQGRVMTSTAEGRKGLSFGWINHDLIASGKPSPHMNAFGGEERFWLGPEGGQFSLYFKKGSAFTYENWFVPKEFDSEPFGLIASDNNQARFEKKMHLVNYSGNAFDLTVNRTVKLLGRLAVDSILGIRTPPGVKLAAFESDNQVTNTGTAPWDKKTGMVSVWILSMLNASDRATVAVPFKTGDSSKLGKIVTDDYFGKVPVERLQQVAGKGLLLFKADARYRSKIGISPARALPYVAAYDAVNKVLTFASYSLPDGARDYVNSLWQLQDHPFSGDAVNAYNDGPIDGKQMGQFFEIESSSPAASLAPGASILHIHRIIHFKGSEEDLDKIAEKLLGVGVDSIRL